MKQLINKIVLILSVTLGLVGCNPTPQTSSSSPISVCFTPGAQCVQDVINSINLAQNNIYMQANAITSNSIANALIAAKQRKVNISILLDKSQMKQKSSVMLKNLINKNIPIWIDAKPMVANNKVLVIDNTTVVTGSFNFGLSHQENNASNVLVIKDSNLASVYVKNWENRQKDSIDFAQYLSSVKQKLAYKQAMKPTKLAMKR